MSDVALPVPAGRRPVDVLGIVALVVAALALAPSLFVFVVGLVPDMNAIWWLGIVLIPLLLLAGCAAILLAVLGIVVARRRGGRFVMSVIALVLGVLMIVPAALIYLPSLIEG